MTEIEVLEAYEFGEYITHPKNPDAIYAISQIAQVHIDGVWAAAAVYSDILKGGGDTYVRRLDEFQKFEMLFE